MDNSASAQRKVLRSLKYQIDTLAQFIVRLTTFYQGAQPTLDDELSQLRHHLDGKLDFDQAETSMRNITGLILDQNNMFRQVNLQAESLVKDVLLHLRSYPALPCELTRDIDTLEHQIKTAPLHFSSSLPLFEQLLTLQRRALDTVPSLTKQDAGDSQEPVKDHLLFELRELVGQLKQKNQHHTQIEEIEQRLSLPLNEQQLIECCLLLLKRLFQSVYQEHAHTEQFVQSLNDSLAAVSANLEQSISDSEQQFEQKQQNNADMRAHMADMQQSIELSDDLAQLKAKSQRYLEKMASSMTDRERHDKDEQTILMRLLGDMRHQLIQLEQETSHYKERLEQIRYQSQNDALTRLPNRHAYNNRIHEEFQHWQNTSTPLSIALIDVDHFKSINDNYGHKAGDKTLQVLAQQITKCLRHTDFMARWGGEEFILVLPDTNTTQLHTPLEKIRQRVERIPFKFKNHQVTITVSIGATEFTQGDTTESAFERADTGLYQAKRLGRNQHVVIKGKE